MTNENEEVEASLDDAVELPPPTLFERIRAYRPGAIMRAVFAGAAVVLLGLVGLAIVESSDRLFAQEKLIAADSGAIQVAPAAAPEKILRSRDGFEFAKPLRDDFQRSGLPTAEPTIFSPQSADNEDFRATKRDPIEFLSYIKGEGESRSRILEKNPGVYDTMGVGVGGGGGGRYGGRFGGRENLVARGGGGSVTVVEPAGTGKVMVPEEIAELHRQNQEEQARANRKIVRSGGMEFEIESFDSAVASIMKIAVEEQGFVSTVNSEKLQNGKVRGIVVVRVPPDRLDTLLLKLRALGDLKSQKIGSDDVTKLYTDLESRLRAAKTMEERLMAIIKEGKGQIKDLLQAEKELGEWRTKIETTVGEINYYNNLISLSTLTLTLYEKEIRAPFGILETERVQMGIEADDVEKTHRDALAAIAEAKGRVTKSELKQQDVGQFNAVIEFEVAPDRAGVLRDRLKQLGTLARLDIGRHQENLGGTGKGQDLKVQQSDTRFLLSIYNLANIAPRETVHLSLAALDAEKSYKAILARVEKAAGRIQSSRLVKPKNDETIGSLSFQLRAADSEAVLSDIRTNGEVMKLEITELPDTTASRSKRGFQVNVFGLGAVQPRETATIVIATRDVALGYRSMLEAAKTADARITSAQLNENDRKNMTASLTFDVRREHESAIADAMGKVGKIYTRNSTRAQDAENVVDSKIQLQLRLFDEATIPAREIVKLGIEVNDVESAAARLEADFKGRVVDARHTREASGRRESAITIDVPQKEMAAAVDRIKSLGTLGEHVATKNAAVPDNDLAMARIEVQMSTDILIAQDSGPWANIRRGLAFSLQAASWSLMLIMVGLCFVLPLVLLGWTVVRIRRKLRPKVA